MLESPVSMNREVPDRLPPFLRAFNHSNFRIYFAGQFISVSGTWMQMVALAWLIYDLSASPFILGLAGFIGQSPVFFLAPLAGVVADRYDRKRMLLITQALFAVLAASLAMLSLMHLISIPIILVMMLASGILTAFDFPLTQTFIVELVEREHLANAIALNTTLWNGGRVLGPAAAGLLLGSYGAGICFALNAITFLAVIISLLLIRVSAAKPEKYAGSHLAHFRQGWQYVRATVPVRLLLVLLGIMSLIGYAPNVLMPVIAEDVLGGGATTLGWLMGAMGVGALLGGLSLAILNNVHGLGRVVAATTGAYGLFLILFASSGRVWLSIPLVALTGFCLMGLSTASNSLLQYMVPDSLRGRVMSFYSMMWLGMTPVSSLLAGTVASRIGAPAALAAGGVFAILAAALFGLYLPKFWRIEIGRASCRERV